MNKQHRSIDKALEPFNYFLKNAVLLLLFIVFGSLDICMDAIVK